MQSETLNQVMHEVEALTSSLSSDEKLTIAAALTAQARQERVNGKASNGTLPSQQPPDEAAPTRQQELEWLKQHSREFAGQYVAILGDKLVAHAETLRELDRLIEAAGAKRPAITRIRAEGEVLSGQLETPSESHTEPVRHRQREYAWLKEHRHEYPGEYLALDGDRLVSHGTNGRGVLDEARRAGVPLPLMVRVGENEELPYCGGW